MAIATLQEQLTNAMKQAMKARDKSRLAAIRMVRSAIRDKEIELRKPLDDAGVLEIIANQIKKRREVIAQLKDSDRTELIEMESQQIEVLAQFLPPQLSEPEITELATNVINELGATSIRDMGKVMGKLIPQVRGKADNGLVSQIVRKQLEFIS